MDHVFKRGQVHQKEFGHSPPRHNSEVCFYRYRRDADPSPFLSVKQGAGKRMGRGLVWAWAFHAEDAERGAEIAGERVYGR